MGIAGKRLTRVAAKSIFAAMDLFFSDLCGPRILLYHQVGVRLGREMEVSMSVFEAQLDWVESKGKVVDLEYALAATSEPGADKFFVLTFDDGYADIFENAFPILRDRQYPFTVYLNTQPVETGVPLFPAAEPLTWSQIHEMSDTGLVTIGAHTHSHADLRYLTVDRVCDELGTSNELIAYRTGKKPRHFAYPWGCWSSQAEPLIRESYDTAALAVVDSMNEDTDLHRLPRIPIQQSDGLFFFKRKVSRGLRLEDKVRRRLKGLQVP